MKGDTTTSMSKEQPPAPRPRSISAVKSGLPTGPEPPDSGWSWVVLFGTFLETTNAIGYIGALSVFFMSWRNEFESSAAATSIVISIGGFARGIASPVVGALFTKFSGRTVMITGGLISSLGILLTSFGTSIPYLAGTTGILAAIGFSFTSNSSFIMLRCYFKRRYSLAVGLTLAGVSAGQLALPPLYTWLNNEYGWRGALFIISAINLHIVAAGALMRPVRAKKVKGGMKNVPPEVDRRVNTNIALNEKITTGELESAKEIPKEDSKEHLDDVRDDARAENDVVGLPSLNAELDTFTLVVEDVDADPEDTTDERLSKLEADDKYPVMHNIIASPFMLAIPDDRISRVSSVVHTKPDGPCGLVILSLKKARTFLLDTYGLRGLAHNLPFILVCFMAFSMAYGWSTMSVHLVPRAEFVGLDSEVSSLFLSIMGGVGLVCRPFVGWVIDQSFIRAELLYSAAMIELSLAEFVVPFFTSFGPLATDALFLGLGAGVSGSSIMVVLHSVVRRPEEQAAATGMYFLFWGLGEISGGFFAGFLFDVTESYDYSFYFSGAITLAAGIVALIVYFLLKTQERRQGAKLTAAIAVENPGFIASRDENFVSNHDKPANGTAVGSAGWSHEAVNPLYTMERGEVWNHTVGLSVIATDACPAEGNNNSEPATVFEKNELPDNNSESSDTDVSVEAEVYKKETGRDIDESAFENPAYVDDESDSESSYPAEEDYT